MNKQAYNMTVSQLTTAKKGKNVNGKPKLTFRAKTTLNGREVERTVVAQGAAADLIAGIVRKGSTFAVRGLIERAPNNADGSKGGEYITVVALPREKKAA